MAVGASDIAFLYFVLDHRPRNAVANHAGNRVSFVPSDVIKFEDYSIIFATINARMFLQEIIDRVLISQSIAAHVAEAMC